MSIPFPIIEKPIKQKPKLWKYFFLLIVFLVILLAVKEYFEDYVIQKDDGSYELNPKIVKQLQKDTAKFRNAEQYVLVAKENAWYPCLTCPDTNMIFLFRNEVWKYGVTINNEKLRYSGINSPQRNNLYYVPQYKGDIGECLRQERIKIMRYALLPENLKRKIKLAKPPYNPVNR